MGEESNPPKHIQHSDLKPATPLKLVRFNQSETQGKLNTKSSGMQHPLVENRKVFFMLLGFCKRTSEF